MKNQYKKTIYACFISYIVQAVVNNFVPLLFLHFQWEYGISLSRITFLVTVNFAVQLLVDFMSVPVINRVGYRAAMIAAHALSATGLILLTFLPEVVSVSWVGLCLAVIIYAVGGGLLEVLVSPIVEACPTEHKEKAMSMLHSFYCWGHVGVVLISTMYFRLFGIGNWRILAFLWAMIPTICMILFFRVPIASLGEEEGGHFLGALTGNRLFWIFLILMVCAGASEQAVSQWASAFAEKGLGVEKAIGDLAGPMFFALMMGISRAVYGQYGERWELKKVMTVSGVFCVGSYLLMVFSPQPVLGFIGCGLCGFSVGIFWPGTFSLAAASIKRGGTAMFAFLALAGDLGCSAGPTLVGIVSGWFGSNLKAGIFSAIVFPLLLVMILVGFVRGKKTAE